MQFDVHVDRVGTVVPLLLDVQADRLSNLATRVVVPLAVKRRYPATPIRRLNPIVVVRGVEYVAVFQQLAAIQAAQLGEVRGSLSSYRSELIAALDLLITGS